MHIRTTDGVEIPIEDVLIDPQEGRIVTVVTTYQDRLIPLPWRSIHVSSGDGGGASATIEITRERLTSAPTIERSQITSFNAESLQRKWTVIESAQGDLP
jgi:hypothetical protein